MQHNGGHYGLRSYAPDGDVGRLRRGVPEIGTVLVNKETFDIGLVPQRSDYCKYVCELMFTRCGCMTYPGHTTTMLQLIKKTRLLHTSAGQPRTVGDVRKGYI